MACLHVVVGVALQVCCLSCKVVGMLQVARWGTGALTTDKKVGVPGGQMTLMGAHVGGLEGSLEGGHVGGLEGLMTLVWGHVGGLGALMAWEASHVGAQGACMGHHGVVVGGQMGLVEGGHCAWGVHQAWEQQVGAVSTPGNCWVEEVVLLGMLLLTLLVGVAAEVLAVAGSKPPDVD